MGTWTIVIEGHGINHNGTPKDADEMGKALVAALRASGHTEVKGYFLYGPKLATAFVEATMKRGTGSRLAEPLSPLCDQRTFHSDRNGGWSEPCLRPAVEAIVQGQEIITVRCKQDEAYPEDGDTPLPENCKKVPL